MSCIRFGFIFFSILHKLCVYPLYFHFLILSILLTICLPHKNSQFLGDALDLTQNVSNNDAVTEIPASDIKSSLKQQLTKNEYKTHKKSIIQSLLMLLKVDDYFKDETIDFIVQSFQFIAIIACIIYQLRDDIRDFLSVHAQKKNKKPVHIYPSPNQRGPGRKDKIKVNKKEGSTFNDAILIITLQIAIMAYTTLAFSFTPWHEDNGLEGADSFLG